MNVLLYIFYVMFLKINKFNKNVLKRQICFIWRKNLQLHVFREKVWLWKNIEWYCNWTYHLFHPLLVLCFSITEMHWTLRFLQKHRKTLWKNNLRNSKQCHCFDQFDTCTIAMIESCRLLSKHAIGPIPGHPMRLKAKR